MTTDNPATATLPDAASTPLRPLRVWPWVLLVALYWGLVFAIGQSDWVISYSFMTKMAAGFLLLLAFVGLLVFNGTMTRGERLFTFLALAVCVVTAGVLCDPSMGPIGLVFAGIPMALTVWLVALVFLRKRSGRERSIVSACVLAVVFTALMSIRVDGVDGSNQAAVSLRWSRSAEDRYLADRNKGEAPAAKADSSEPLVAGDGDWTDFRGPNRQGDWHGPAIATDWNVRPPQRAWQQRVGPAWSSVLVIGDRLFTQEQRAEAETLVCLDAATGREIWSHEDKARFADGQAGAGPRATPVFAGGKIFTQGATGILNCLEASTGKLIWTRDIVEDSKVGELKAPLPMWGFSSSPLVADGLVITFAGGPADKGMLAYHEADGTPAWNIATGPISYSSPQLATLDGEKQVLLLSDAGLLAVDLKTGDERWNYIAPGSGIWRVVQPRQIGENTILTGSEDLGFVRLEIKRDGDKFTVTPTWSARTMRPAYNDFIVAGNFAYGFDEAIFCCIDLETGKRRWKGGRYGHGQVLHLVDQQLLIVATETGEAVLLSANPDKPEELGRFQAIKGKTWNHPVVAHGRLFMRNDEEIAAFNLRPAGTADPTNAAP